MGLCAPKECDSTSLKKLDKLYMKGVQASGRGIHDPLPPDYTFPT